LENPNPSWERGAEEGPLRLAGENPYSVIEDENFDSAKIFKALDVRRRGGSLSLSVSRTHPHATLRMRSARRAAPRAPCLRPSLRFSHASLRAIREEGPPTEGESGQGSAGSGVEGGAGAPLAALARTPFGAPHTRAFGNRPVHSVWALYFYARAPRTPE
jgi:hypothetical protein